MAEKCTKCGKRRQNSFICLFSRNYFRGASDITEKGYDVPFKSPDKLLCKECDTSKNRCRHRVCLDNYWEEVNPKRVKEY